MNQTTTANKLDQTALPLQSSLKGSYKKKETLSKFYIELNDALKELKRCNTARIDGNEFSCKTVLNYITGCHFEEVFKFFYQMKMKKDKRLPLEKQVIAFKEHA